MQAKLYIEVKKVKNNSGETFNAFKTPIGEKFKMDVKFQKACKNVPKKSGYYDFDTDKLNLDTDGVYPTLWVRA